MLWCKRLRLFSGLCFPKDVALVGISINDIELHVSLDDISSIRLQATPDDVATFDGTDTLGGTGQNHVTLFQGHDLADIAQDAGDVEEHEVGVILLLDLVIDTQPDEDVMGVCDSVAGDFLTDGEKGVETLCDGPRQTLLFGLILHIARRQVDAEEIAADAVKGLGVARRQVLQRRRRLPNHQSQLHFIV